MFCSRPLGAPEFLYFNGIDLAGRAFLHTHDWKAGNNFATLELILTAPVVVASWISLQYYGSTLSGSVFWRRQQANS